MYYYKINDIDISSYVVQRPSINVTMGRLANFSATTINIGVVNLDGMFSPEKSTSILYDYRDAYEKIIVKIVNEKDEIFWHGIVDNITRNQDDLTTITSTQSIMSVLEAQAFAYKDGDGYINDQAFAGADATLSEHQLAFLRRYVSDDIIDFASFRIAKELQDADGLQVDCSIEATDEKKPVDFLKSLCLGISELFIINNKIYLHSFKPFYGDYGFFIPENKIYNISNIQKTNNTDVYSRYVIKYDDTGTPTDVSGSIGDTGTSSSTTSTALQDDTLTGDDLWTVNEHIGKYIEIGATEILYITGNNKNTIFFSGGSLTGAQTYTILNDNRIYSQDYSAYPIKVTAGADAIGVNILLNQVGRKLTMDITVDDYFDFVRSSVNVTLNIPDEGIIYQPFVIDRLSKELDRGLVSLSVSDLALYPLKEDYALTVPGTPTALEGRRDPDGLVSLWWTASTGAAFYRIYMGTTESTMILVDISQTATADLTGLNDWYTYYFQVSAISSIGVESDGSNILELLALEQDAGYIDASEGYFRNYNLWGLIEDYFYQLTYKNLNSEDIKFLSKSKLSILSNSQSTSSSEVTQGWAVEQLTEREQAQHRSVGYVDGAGSSTILPEFVTTTKQIKNPFTDKALTFGGITYAAGETIENTSVDSADWFLTDGAGGYFTYWFETGHMMDITNTDMIDWFKVWKIDKAMGIFDYGTCQVGIDGVLVDTDQAWNVNQWVNYYVALETDEGKVWYKIQSNTANTVTILVADDYTFTGRYIVNSDPYKGFDGIFIDDIWDAVYKETYNCSNDSGGADFAGATWVTDSDKAWLTNQWVGAKVQINGAGTWFTITDNDATTINFSGTNGTVGVYDYEIVGKFFFDTGKTYAEAMEDFITIFRAHAEDRSFQYNNSWSKVENGNVILNTWCNDWAVYNLYIEAMNKRYKQYVMFEALQSTWNMDNEITKQFIVRDWWVTKDRWNLMKQDGDAGYIKMVTLGYPHSDQMYMALLMGGVSLSRYSDRIEDIIQGGNIVLNQLYYKMIQARHVASLETLGIPENDYTPATYDKYAVISRRLEGAEIFFNPTRKIIPITHTFPETVYDYHTGDDISSYNQSLTFLLGRSANIFYRSDTVGEDAGVWLNNYKPYSYIDTNMCWVVFTEAGRTLIDDKSVWIEGGYGHNKRIIIDSDAVIPVGTISQLFHAGTGSNINFVGHDPLTESVTGLDGTGTGSILELTSTTVLAVVGLYDEDASAWLVMGTDYLIEYHESSDTAGLKGTWKTDIEFVTDQDGVNITVYYYEQGTIAAGDYVGYPDKDYATFEHGVLYKSTGFKLLTGGVDQADATTEMVFGTDYFLVPEATRWQWDYRFRIDTYGGIDENYTINTKNFLKYSGTNNIQGIHWGDVNPENLILIDPTAAHANSYNGAKATYTDKTISKPRLLLYGFPKAPRDADYETIAIADRVYNAFRDENQLKDLEGVLYDTVEITGHYDGIDNVIDTGAWGSIQGYLDANSYLTYEEALADFDVVIILDNFLEISVSSPSLAVQYASWLAEVDYNFLKAFKNDSTMIIDKRFGATSFVWYGGTDLISDELKQFGAKGNINLAGLFGTFYYAGIDYDSIGSANSNIYLDEDGTQKFSGENGIDLRIFDSSIAGITDHYKADYENSILPIYNKWENGGTYLSYIPKSPEYREGQIIEKSKLFVLSYNLEDSTIAWKNYDQVNLDNIIERKESCFIWHFYNSGAGADYNWELLENLIAGTHQLGNRQSLIGHFLIFQDTQYVFSPLVSQNLDFSTIFQGKYFIIPEWTEGENALDMSANHTDWKGFRGFYINNEAGINEFGFSFTDEVYGGSTEMMSANLSILGDATPPESMDGWSFPALQFSNYCGFANWIPEYSKFYPLSTYTGDSPTVGVIPRARQSKTYEFKVVKIEESINSNNAILTIQDTVSSAGVGLSSVAAEEPTFTGTVLNATETLSFKDGKVYTKFVITIEINETFTGASISMFMSADEGTYNGYGLITKTADPSIVIFSFTLKGSWSYSANMIGKYVELSPDTAIWHCAFIPNINDAKENAVFNTPIVRVLPDDSKLHITLSRVVAVEEVTQGYVGVLICWKNNPDIDIKSSLGGYYSQSEIASKFYSKGKLKDDGTPFQDFPGLIPYEYNYRDRIKEFGFDYNTGLVTAHANFYNGIDFPPVIVWNGIGIDDINNLVKKWIGTEITFTGLEADADKKLYVYYNSLNDMLWIDSEDVESPDPWPYKVGSYTLTDILKNNGS
jgi:hypothetical protein